MGAGGTDSKKCTRATPSEERLLGLPEREVEKSAWQRRGPDLHEFLSRCRQGTSWSEDELRQLRSDSKGFVEKMTAFLDAVNAYPGRDIAACEEQARSHLAERGLPQPTTDTEIEQLIASLDADPLSTECLSARVLQAERRFRTALAEEDAWGAGRAAWELGRLALLKDLRIRWEPDVLRGLRSRQGGMRGARAGGKKRARKISAEHEIWIDNAKGIRRKVSSVIRNSRRRDINY